MNTYCRKLSVPFGKPYKSQEWFDSIPIPEHWVGLSAEPRKELLCSRREWEPDVGGILPVEYPEMNTNQYTNEQFVSWLDSLGLFCPGFDIFLTPPGGTVAIHADTYDWQAKLNFAYGSDDGVNEQHWWKPKSENLSTPTDRGDQFYSRLWQYEDVDLVHKEKIGTPSLINIGIPHSVVNYTPQTRICLSYNLNKKSDRKPLLWEEAVEIFGAYVCTQ